MISPRDSDYYDKYIKKPECPYWGDGKHLWCSTNTPDYRYTNLPQITLRCRRGATKEVND